MQQKNLPNGNFPSRLKSILQSKNMKQRELGKLAGLSNVAISRYLSGERRPGADELYRISTILGVSMEWLLVGTEPEQKIKVNNLDISISIESNKDDYFCLTDIIKDKEGEDHIRNWMRNKNTIEFLGTWEILNNPDFKGVEFDTFLNQAGLNRFNMTPKKWIEATNAIGIVSKAGRNGGTYAHKDIALEFCSWFNPTFKLYLLKEYQRLKEFENDPLKVEWKIKRILSKTNNSIHQTDY